MTSQTPGIQIHTQDLLSNFMISYKISLSMRIFHVSIFSYYTQDNDTTEVLLLKALK